MLSTRQIADRAGLTSKALFKRAKKLGVEPERHGRAAFWTPAQARKLTRLGRYERSK